MRTEKDGGGIVGGRLGAGWGPVGGHNLLKYVGIREYGVNSVESAKGSEVATARLDGETMERLDADAEELGECRADQMRRAITVWHLLRDGEFVCPSCGEEIEVNL